LAAAQELMKIMAGAVNLSAYRYTFHDLTLAPQNPDAQPDYRSKTMHELEKLQAHVILLNEMLDNIDPKRPDRLVTGDAYDVRCALRSLKFQRVRLTY
jgi:ADP-ribosylation factor-binding protein GGA